MQFSGVDPRHLGPSVVRDAPWEPSRLYNLGNSIRKLALPKSVKHWSLGSVEAKLIHIDGVRCSMQRGWRFS